MLAETFIDLVQDKNHWLFEGLAALVEFIVVGLLVTPLAKRWVRNHDKVHHDHECENDEIVPTIEERIKFLEEHNEAWLRDNNQWLS